MTRRVTITLDQEHFDLLKQLAEYYGHPPATLAGDMLVQTMFDAEEAVFGASMRGIMMLNELDTSQKPH